MHTEMTFYKVWAAISYALTYGIILPLFVVWFFYIMINAFWVRKPKADPAPEVQGDGSEQGRG